MEAEQSNGSRKRGRSLGSKNLNRPALDLTLPGNRSIYYKEYCKKKYSQQNPRKRDYSYYLNKRKRYQEINGLKPRQCNEMICKTPLSKQCQHLGRRNKANINNCSDNTENQGLFLEKCGFEDISTETPEGIKKAFDDYIPFVITHLGKNKRQKTFARNLIGAAEGVTQFNNSLKLEFRKKVMKDLRKTAYSAASLSAFQDGGFKSTGGVVNLSAISSLNSLYKNSVAPDRAKGTSIASPMVSRHSIQRYNRQLEAGGKIPIYIHPDSLSCQADPTIYIDNMLYESPIFRNRGISLEEKNTGKVPIECEIAYSADGAELTKTKGCVLSFIKQIDCEVLKKAGKEPQSCEMVQVIGFGEGDDDLAMNYRCAVNYLI
jgi:hypothetical protein